MYKYEKEFRADNPQTIGETDKHFDLDNYKDWLEEKYEQLSQPKEVIDDEVETVEQLAIKYARQSYEWPKNKQGEPVIIPPANGNPPNYRKHSMVATKHFIAGYNHAQSQLTTLKKEKEELVEALEQVAELCDNQKEEFHHIWHVANKALSKHSKTN